MLHGLHRDASRARGRVAATSGLLSFLSSIAVALATIVLCAALPGLATKPTASVATTCVLRALSPELSHGVQGDAPERTTDLKAVENDLDDDDDDPLCHTAGEAHGSFRFIAAPRHTGTSWRGEAHVDTSCFATGSGLPRGPPV